MPGAPIAVKKIERDLSAALGITEWNADSVEVATGTTTEIDQIIVDDETIGIVEWDFTLYTLDVVGVRSGKLRTIIYGPSEPTSIPFSIEEVPSAGLSALVTGTSLSIVHDGGGVYLLQLTNTTGSTVYATYKARKKEVGNAPAPPPLPQILLTISGISAGQNWRGLTDGVHTLVPDSYWRGELGSTLLYTTYWTGSARTCSSNQKLEEWCKGNMGVTTTYTGSSDAGWGLFALRASGTYSGTFQSTGSSSWTFNWNDPNTTGSYTDTYSSTSSSATGFLIDANTLSGSCTLNGVTFTWQRASQVAGVWANY